jgi:hypothetical protein
VELSDEQSLARAFQKVSIMKQMVCMSPNLKMPPDTARNLHNSLVYFKIPKSILERKVRIFLMGSIDQAKDRISMLPSKVIGSTDTLD